MSRTMKKRILPEHDRLPFRIIETSDQRASLYDSVRQEILRVLTEGYEYYSSETKRQQRTLDDGIRITEEIKIEKPVRRYWMTVPEILNTLRNQNPDLKLATTKAYYHLGKLHEQGLLEQYPETVSGKKTRVRGRYFRLTSRFFVEVTVEASVGYSGISVMPKEIGPRFVELAEGIRQTGVTASLEYQVNLDSVLLWVSMTMSRHPDGLNIIAVVRDITTHRTLEERLLRSKVEFGRLVEESFQSYAIFQDERLVFTNPAYAKIVGWSQNELNLMTPEKILEMIHPDDRTTFEERNSDFRAGVEKFPRHRFRYILPDGSIHWVESFARKTEHLGRPALLALEVDITEQIKAEESVRRSERRFREIFDSSPVAIGRCDLEGRFVEMNQAYLDLFGIHDIEDGAGYRLPNDSHIPEWAMEKVSKGSSANFDVTYDFELIRKLNLYGTSKKGTIDLVVTIVPLNLPKEDPEAGNLVMVQDITERLIAEERLRDSEERYRAFFEQAVDSIVVFDSLTMKIIDYNRHAHESLGYTQEEFEELHIWEIDALEDKTKVEALIMEIAEKGNLVFETKHKTKRGNVIDVRISSRVVSFRDRITNQWIITDITERKSAAEALKESEQRNRMIVDTMSDLVLVFDSEGRYREYFAKDESLLIRPWDEMKGRKTEEFVPQAVATDYYEKAKKVRETGESITYENEIEIGSSLIWFRGTIMLHKDGESIVVAMKNIHDRKTAEGSLVQSEEKYRVLYEKLSDALFLSDRDGRITLCNDMAIELFGYDKGEILGIHFTELLHPEDRQWIQESHEKYLNTGTSIIGGFEAKARRKDGAYFDVHITNTILMEEGKPAGYQSLIQDITKRKRAEEMLRKSEVKFRTIFEQVAIGITRVSPDGVMIEANKKIEQMLSYNEGELVGVNVFEITPEEDSQIEKQFVAEILAGERESYSMEKRVFRKDGSIMWGDVTVSVLRNSLGDIDYAIGVFEDISARKSNEAIRFHQEREIELYSSLLRHDLINDLGLILNYTEAVQMLLESPDEEVMSFLNSALGTVERTTELLKSFGRPQEVREVDVVDFIKTIADEAQQVEKGLKVSVTYKKGTKNIRITAGGLLSLVFINLFRNTAQHVGDSPEVEVQVSKDENQIEIIVSDNGPGVPEEFQEKLFRRGTSSKGEAGGLGLHLCKQIIERTGGTIKLQKEKEGASFRITLPIN